MRPCAAFCADSNEVNHNITDEKSDQTSLLKVYLKICRDSMRQILTNNFLADKDMDYTNQFVTQYITYLNIREALSGTLSPLSTHERLILV